ncbi:MAG: hypothetical protein LBL34_06870 [Clostridiales bacterium]|jgi:hypothetical protein|nr:hypothetical protein [Clostridiales bacterium]
MEYKIYNPGGNKTALVMGLEYDYKGVNSEIMRDNPDVEQVGFVATDGYELKMAGGEFCGNACRCAANYYLGGKQGEIELETAAGKVKCGINERGETWVELPKPTPRAIAEGIYLVEMEGITHIVIDKASVGAKCVGVIPYESGAINPFVWVRDINTFFNETGCLSGSVAVASVMDVGKLRQPSQADYKIEKNDLSIKVSGTVE